MTKTTLPPTMRAARVHARGASRFDIETIETPRPGPGQLLIRVEAASVNFSDVKRRRGDPYPFETTFPFVPGGEIAGTVVAHGAGVDGPPVGTRVFALAGPNGFGGYAQFAVSYAATAVPYPAAMEAGVASVITVAGGTAKLMVEHVARVRDGESVLIPAAAGGVGSFAVQIARRAGAGNVIALVGSAAKRAAALDLGAHEVIVANEPGWSRHVLDLTRGKGVDVAFEATGGDALEETFACLAPFGRLVVFGAATGRNGDLSSAALGRLLYDPALNQSLHGFNVGAWFQLRPEVAGPALGNLLGEVASGAVRPPPIRSLPLASAQEAHELLEGRRVIGKLVLDPWS